MTLHFAPFFALQAVGLLIFCAALTIATKAPQRNTTFYIFLASLGLELVGTLLRMASFVFGSELALIDSSRNNLDVWAKLESLGVQLFALGLLFKPLFFLSLSKPIRLRHYVYPLLLWLSLVLGANAEVLHLGYSPKFILVGIIFVVGASVWLLVQLQHVRFQKELLIDLQRYSVWFLITFNLLFAAFFVYASVDFGASAISFETFRSADILLRYIRITIFVFMDALCLFYWIQNYSTQAITLKKNQKRVEELVAEKDLLIQNLINANALVRTGALAAGVSHELNQFLARIQLDVEAVKIYVSEKEDDAKTLKVLNRVLAANKSAAALILNLKKLFIRQDEDMKRCDVDQVVRSVLELYLDRARQSNISCELKLQANVRVLLRESLMRQVIANLVSNAIEALDLTGRSDKKIVIETQLEGGRWTLRVEDNATGIRPENAHKIFSLFATSKNEGTGIGLWLSRFIVEQHGGYMRFSNVEPEGVVFWVDMPVEPVQDVDKEGVSKVLPL